VRAVLLALALGVLTMAPGLPSTRASAATLPNIVLILTDDQRWDLIDPAMPNVRSMLSAKGVTFTNGFVVESLCCPSRASILTGKYPHGTGVYSNGGPHGGFDVFDDSSTIATWLDRRYQTALMGKYLNGYDRKYVPPGWDQWVTFFDMPNGGGYYNYNLLLANEKLEYHGRAPGDYSTDALAKHANRFIRSANPSSPLFLYFAPFAPHKPFDPAPQDAGAYEDMSPYRPPSFNEIDVSDKPLWIQKLRPLNPYQQAKVDAFRRHQLEMMRSVDRAVGTIVRALRDTDRLSNTLIVFTSDNGFSHGEHRWTNKKAPYEEDIRVPFIVRYDPMTRGRASTKDSLVLNIDLAPTFARAARVSVPSEVDGESLLPLLKGRAPFWREDFLIEYMNANSRDPVPTYCALRNKRFMYAVLDSGERELYDLKADPYQLTNLAHILPAPPPYLQVQLQMAARLAELCQPPPPGYDPLALIP
jgi:arylsulfatase A-like enzyme